MNIATGYETNVNENPTQCALILTALLEHPNEWVPMPELARVSGAYAVATRISNLRAKVHPIETKVEGQKPKLSWYRILVPATQSNAENQ